MANSVWITASQFLLFDRYIANHPDEAAMIATLNLSFSPRLIMTLMGPIFGVVSGVLLGLFAVVASKFVTPRASAQ
jgi:hypothetical protein